MAGFTTAAIVVGGVLAAAGTVAQISQQQKAAKAQKKARKAEEQRQAVAARRERLQALRRAQLSRATAVNTATNIGSGQTSGIAGGASSVGSQAGEALGFSTQMSGLSRQISHFQQQAANAITSASAFGSVAGLGFSALSYGLSQPSPTKAPDSVLTGGGGFTQDPYAGYGTVVR